MAIPDKIAFTAFGLDVAWYGIIIAVGIMTALLLATKSAKIYGWDSDNVYDFAIIGVPAGIIGARLYYVIFEWKQYSSNILSIFNIRQGGLAILGGIIGGIIAAVIFCKVKKKNIIELLDIAMPSLAIGQAIGRWGNFFNQEAFGGIITNPKLQFFPIGVFIQETSTVHYATFFYESIWCGLICTFLLTQRKKFKYSGDVALWYLMLYGFERMIIEGLRTDSLYIGNIRVSQALSAILFFSVLIFMLVRYLKNKNKSILITNKANINYNKLV